MSLTEVILAPFRPPIWQTALIFAAVGALLTAWFTRRALRDCGEADRGWSAAMALAAVVLIAHVAGRNNDMTALGAHLFFWGRIAHAAAYMGGLVGWRTLAFAVAQTGSLLIFLQLL